MFTALCITFAMEGLTFLEAGNISCQKHSFLISFSLAILYQHTVEFP